jgi:hypothetical protein
MNYIREKRMNKLKTFLLWCEDNQEFMFVMALISAFVLAMITTCSQ